MSDSLDKVFGTLEVMWFNRHGHGPLRADIAVRANLSPSTFYPETRISLAQYSADPREMRSAAGTPVRSANAADRSQRGGARRDDHRRWR